MSKCYKETKYIMYDQLRVRDMIMITFKTLGKSLILSHRWGNPSGSFL